ncbi:hypothetical protein CN326_14035 [Bacillus sp. AFS018417]|uniref:PH domain-containing protein n=1 Tax=Bacillus sp. AFS018417 TaxID=2033491 RepID=UPI000BF2DE81|nr:PH domain-containing protein [Bacillus sp. AFS018417]PEZ05578.1 hypothetical protein CN326_14035 [Bacillus sp. AFS018417]
MAKIDKLKEQAIAHLDPNETVFATVMGAYETKTMGHETLRNGVFLATDKRIFFYGKRTFGYDSEMFPYENISSLEMGKGFMGHKISFFASGNKVKMKYIQQGDVQKFIEHVKSSIGKKSTAEQVNTTPTNDSVVDEIKKFAELKEQGILSEEEFQAKKKQLLGI